MWNVLDGKLLKPPFLCVRIPGNTAQAPIPNMVVSLYFLFTIRLSAADFPGGHFKPGSLLTLIVLHHSLFLTSVFYLLWLLFFGQKSCPFYITSQWLCLDVLPVYWPVTGELTFVLELFLNVVLILSAVLNTKVLICFVLGLSSSRGLMFSEADLWFDNVYRRTMAFKEIFWNYVT